MSKKIEIRNKKLTIQSNRIKCDDLRNLRRPFPLIPAILFSADCTKLLDMSKPFSIPVLKARVKNALELKRLHEVEVRSAALSELLYEIMPPHICSRLVGGETVVSESHQDVTILFSDIVGWTEIAEALPTAGIVRLLNHLFSAFDELTELHHVFKVETIGDA